MGKRGEMNIVNRELGDEHNAQHIQTKICVFTKLLLIATKPRPTRRSVNIHISFAISRPLITPNNRARTSLLFSL